MTNRHVPVSVISTLETHACVRALTERYSCVRAMTNRHVLVSGLYSGDTCLCQGPSREVFLFLAGRYNNPIPTRFLAPGDC
jgi:hypothetical protein